MSRKRLTLSRTCQDIDKHSLSSALIQAHASFCAMLKAHAMSVKMDLSSLAEQFSSKAALAYRDCMNDHESSKAELAWAFTLIQDYDCACIPVSKQASS